ncbi:MAG: pentapeptide repeat-containing protein [Armatimonadetes bacterium]|nr:pentapeptide repeat-containing protein [Armatimonadota bacterium]
MGAALQLRSEEPVLEVRHRRTGVRLLRLTADSLSGADLRYQCLRGADLRLAELTHADLQGADLRGADLREADLRGADLRDANLRFADLRYADLRYVQYNRCTRWPRFFRLQPR